jgi:hypothetical protein
MDYVHLVGTEAVASAGVTIREAAHEMTRAANQADERLVQFERFLDEWLDRLTDVLKGSPHAC